jgi:coenzyme F420-reducing hydrogenase delta subunit
MQYPPNVIPITVMCSGSVSPLYIFDAFNKGADGVLVSGCHPGDCHYIKGNYYARRRIAIVKKLLDFIGLEPERFQMSWVSAAEGKKYTQIISGPSNQAQEKYIMVNVEDLRKEAKRILKEGKVKYVIGYERGQNGLMPKPAWNSSQRLRQPGHYCASPRKIHQS